MPAPFIKTCTHCGKLGAPFTVKDSQQRTVQLCQSCLDRLKKSSQ